jgi:hypothetical protein
VGEASGSPYLPSRITEGHFRDQLDLKIQCILGSERGDSDLTTSSHHLAYLQIPLKSEPFSPEMYAKSSQYSYEPFAVSLSGSSRVQVFDPVSIAEKMANLVKRDPPAFDLNIKITSSISADSLNWSVAWSLGTM